MATGGGSPLDGGNVNEGSILKVEMLNIIIYCAMAIIYWWR
jgi:hypothetical protein